MLNNQKHYLVIPHHGGRAGKETYSISNAKKIEGIVSVGPTNTYGHPNAIVMGKIGLFLRPNIEMTMIHGDIVKSL